MACTDVQTIQAGNGSKTQFSFDFPYIFKSEIHVYFWNAATKEYDEILTDGLLSDDTNWQGGSDSYPWRITDANPTIVEFTGTAPPSPTTPTDPGGPTVDNVKIRRITKIDDIRALFNPGSAIRSDDLNKNFEQLRYAVQESNCQGIPDDVDAYLKNYYWDNFDSTVYSTETWVSSDAKVATTAAMDARFQDEATETLTKAELASASNVIPDNDTALPTTGAVKDYVDHVVETDVLVNSTGLEKSASNGQVTLGIAAGSVDLDRIKAADIITSSESNPNNDTTIATTAKIDDMIDAAITGDIAGSDGVSITNDGDGTITVGLSDNSVDLDKIKDADKITYAEQNAGSPSPADNNLFTASASARRFDTLVQTGTPSGTDWETGKTWLQNDDDQTLKIWNGSTWLDVASGGSFRTQDKVIYVDATGGDDSKTGHRISGPKLTIKGAIADINADISTSIKTAGSGYTNGSYTNVPLTGGTTGSGLQANITVAGGAVTACTVTSTTTLEEYQIGDILSASDSNLGSGGGSGFQLEVTGGGDGMTVIVSAGVYREIAPIQIKRRNVSIVGMALRSTIVHPTPATQGDHADGNNALFELNSGSFIQNLTLTGMQASSSGSNTLDSVLPTRQGWNFALYNNCYLTKSPYIQNCTNFSDSEIDNNDLRAHRPRGGSAGDTDSAPTGGGMLIDGSVPKSTSPLRSMVADSYTHVGLNGPGILVTNNGYTQCTSSYAFFNKYHIKCLNGGQANLAASTTDFGERALVADGKSSSAIFTSNVDGAAADKATTFNINAPAAATGWFGSGTRPQDNMLVQVNSVIYPVVSAVARTDSEGGSGWTVTISRPDPADRAGNLGLNGAVSDNAAVSFFLRSMIASSGHTMEYVGSGTNYSALPENGGVPIEARQVNESNNGKIWTATTDHKGKFALGSFFTVDQDKGIITMETGSIQLDLGTLLVTGTGYAQLGAPLDMNGNEISDESGNLKLDANGDIDVQSNKIINLTNPAANQDAATKAYVDAHTDSSKLPLAGGTLTGALTLSGAPTSNLHAATKAYVDTEVSGLVDSAPSTLNTLNELAAALGDDANFSTTVTNSIAAKMPLAGGTFTGNVDLDDNVKARFGTGDDLEIYHDGSNSKIVDSGTGQLILQASAFRVLNAAGSENIIDGDENGDVNLYYDGSEKLKTKSDGVDITGELECDTLDVDGEANIEGQFKLHTGVVDKARLSTDGVLYLGNNGNSNALTGTTPRVVLNTSNNGGASFAGGNVTIDSSGRLLLGTTTEGEANADDLTVATSGNTGITVRSGTTNKGNIYFSDGTSGDAEYRGYIEYNHDGDTLKLGTANYVRATIDSSGATFAGIITAQAGAVAEIGTLTSGTTVTPDFATHCNFTVTLGHNATIANPSNLVAGQSGSIFLVQDGTGSRTAAFGSYWDFAGGTAPTLTTAASSVDRIDYIVRSSTSIHAVATLNMS